MPPSGLGARLDQPSILLLWQAYGSAGTQRGRHRERHGGRGFSGPSAPQQEHDPRRANPRDGDEVVGQDVGRVVDAEVQPGEADEEDDQGARDRQAPPMLASEAQGVEQGKRAVQGDGDKWEARHRGLEVLPQLLRCGGWSGLIVGFYSQALTGRKLSRLRSWAFRATALMEKLTTPLRPRARAVFRPARAPRPPRG